MKKLLFALSCLLLLSSLPVLARADDPTVVIVRVSEAPLNSSISIARGEVEPEKIKAKNGSDILVATQRVIAGLYAQGYTLQGTSSGGDGAVLISTMVFVKTPKP